MTGLTGWAGERIPGAAAAIEASERKRDAGGGLLAGGLAYRFFFWLLPFGLVIGAGLGFWLEADRAAFDDTARELGMSDVLAGGAADAIEEGRHSRWFLLVVGGGLMTWFSTSAARAIRIAHALAWREPPRPRSCSGSTSPPGCSPLATFLNATRWERRRRPA